MLCDRPQKALRLGPVVGRPAEQGWGAGGVRGAEGEGAGGGSVGTQTGQGEVSAGRDF